MNITGIELLNKIEITKTMPNEALLLFAAGAFLVALVSFIIAVATDTDCDDPLVTLCLISFFASLIFLLLSFAFTNKVPTGRYEYKVYVSKNADVVQLYKNYEFVECRGDIYTFRDLEVENSEDSYCNYNKHSCKNECSRHDRVSPENMKNHNHTLEGNVESENPKAGVPNEPETPAEDIDNVCDNCNTTLEENDKFCSQCGSERKEK